MKFLAVFLALIVAAYCVYQIFSYGRVYRSENWTAKKIGNMYILSLKTGTEVVEDLNDFVKNRKIKAGTVSGIGAANSVTLRFFNPETKKYEDKTFDEQMEIANITGNISTKDGKEYLHIHGTFGDAGYQTAAGHVLSIRINGACELVVEEFPDTKVEREFSEDTGLNLYKF